MSRLTLHKTMLLCSILMSGFCGIVAELSLFNLGNFLIGGMNVVLTATMGVMMFFMGLGSLTVKLNHINKHLYTYFALIETLLSILTASSVIAIYFLVGLAPELNLFWVLLFSAPIGFLIGFEIPLILLINEKLKTPLKDSGSLVLFADYFGSLLAFILFTHFMLVQLGVSKSAILGGGLNWVIALITFIIIGQRQKTPTAIKILLPISALLTGYLFINSNHLMKTAESYHYRDKIIYSGQSEYQKIILTEGDRKDDNPKTPLKRNGVQEVLVSVPLSPSKKVTLEKFKASAHQNDIRFFLNGGLQFSTLDEYYYHEILVHPAMYLLGNTAQELQILIGGGGDGMALREVLKYPNVGAVKVVDLDKEVTGLFTTNPLFCQLNDSAFHDPRVIVHNDDMFSYLKNTDVKYDLILFDFPDPHHDNIAKLYSEQMYKYAELSLKESGYLVSQSTSPYFNRESFLIIHKTMDQIFPGKVVPYKVYMPTFGVWGFNLASPHHPSNTLKEGLKSFTPKVETQFLNGAVVQSSLLWSDLTWRGYDALPVNSVTLPVLVKAYNSRH